MNLHQLENYEEVQIWINRLEKFLPESQTVSETN